MLDGRAIADMAARQIVGIAFVAFALGGITAIVSLWVARAIFGV